MKYKQLGNSTLQISRIGFGCMSLDKDKKNDQLIHHAIDLGINYFDTADLYDKGMNETLLGAALTNKRKDVVIATKVGNVWRSDGSGWDWNPHKEYITGAVEKSLQRLQTDYIDLYQLHGGTTEDPIDEIIEAFEQLAQQGKIRYYGISSIRPNVIREWLNRSDMISIMMQYSLLDRRPEEVLSLLQDRGIGVLARGSIAQGLLATKPAKSFLKYSLGEVQKAKEVVQRFAGPTRNAAQTAMQFVLAQAAVTSAVIGIRTKDQLEEAAKAVDIPQLTEDELELLRSVVPVNYYEQHR